MLSTMTDNVMSFLEILNIFQLERDRPTDQPTERASYRGAMAYLEINALECIAVGSHKNDILNGHCKVVRAGHVKWQ